MNKPTSTADRAAGAARTQAFLQGLVSEMRRVTWPSRQEWIAATLLTVGLVAVVGLFTYSLDVLFGDVFKLIHP